MHLRQSLLKIYWNIEKVVTPNLKYSQDRYEAVLAPFVNTKITWLDLGCGNQILPHWRLAAEANLVNRSRMVIGIDYNLASLKKHKTVFPKIRGDICRLPFKKNSFDLVTANMVVEHLRNASLQFQAINRILKPNGIFLFHTPNAFGYTTIMGKFVPKILKNKIIHCLDGRNEEDIFETYYEANRLKRIVNLAANTGFEIIKTKMIVSTAVFAIIPPLALLELIWIRLLMTKPLTPLRTNVIAILRKRVGEGDIDDATEAVNPHTYNDEKS